MIIFELFKRMARKKSQASTVSRGTPEVIGPIYFSGFKCGSYFGDQPRLCGRSQCKICNPMTSERASVINERFLKERGYE